MDQERWIEPARFRRILGVYQALPGPEATELSVHFGMVRGGRRGGLAAGLGFVLPGLLLMLAASALYVRGAAEGDAFAPGGLLFAASRGAAPAVVVLVARGVLRIGKGALSTPILVAAALLGVATEILEIPFWVGLVGAALIAEIGSGRAGGRAALTLGRVAMIALVAAAVIGGGWWLGTDATGAMEGTSLVAVGAAPELLALFWIGLRGGLLTFGGAYTAIPFVRALAVGPDGFMTDRVFLDGFAIGSLLPAPLVIFATFVGYVGGGLPGALVTTLGMFLPAFAFTLIGFDAIERLVETPRIHAALDGLTAGVVGILAVTVVRLADAALHGLTTILAALAAAALVLLWKSPYAAPAAILAGVTIGLAAA